jgi:hypothetical protein
MSNPSYYVGVAEPGNIISTSTNTSISFTNNLSANQIYYVTVFGIYGNGLFTSPNTMNFLTLPNAPFVTAAALSTTSASLSFVPGTNIYTGANGTSATISYSLVNGTGGSTNYGVSGTTSYSLTTAGSPYTLVSLISNTYYYLGVAASNSSGSNTGYASFTTLPTPPTGITAGSITSSSASISFTPSTNGSANTITYSLSGAGSSWTYSSNAFAVTNLITNTSYTVYIGATNTAGTTTSATYSFTTISNGFVPPTNNGLAWTSYKNNTVFLSTSTTNCLNFINSSTVYITGRATQVNTIGPSNFTNYVDSTTANNGSFAISFSGYFKAPSTGTFTFATNDAKNNAVQDDIMVLWFGTTPNITIASFKSGLTESNYKATSNYTTNSGGFYSVSLTAGYYYPILFNYSQGNGGAQLFFTWATGTYSSANGSAFSFDLTSNFYSN